MKKIIYLDYKENGEKKGAGGFLKLEYRPEGLAFTLQVNSGYPADTLTCPVRDAAGNKTGEIRLERGRGRLEGILREDEMPEWICEGFVEIGISGSRTVTGRWKTEEKQTVCTPEKMPERLEQDPDRGQQTAEETQELQDRRKEQGRRDAEETQELQDRGKEQGRRDTEEKQEPQAGIGDRELKAAENEPESRAPELMTGKDMPETGAEATRQETPAGDMTGNMASKMAGAETPPGEKKTGTDQYYADKWEQLCHVFPKIHPFGDDREYLSISPGDFIIFRQQYQKLVHNSFLLHGFYNYQHLILGKFYQNRRILYYLGTPGVYYEKEKMAAEMFGFEAFEYAGDRIREGTFGYYMRRVEI